MATGKKQYGLIIPNRSKVVGPSKITKPSAFADESSSDEEDTGTVRGKYGSAVWRENKKNAQRLETHGSVTKALSEDPSVFEYDSLYDKMQEDKRKADPRLQKKDTKSKYIAQLKKTADRRKLEQELVYERKVQKEMEKEGVVEETEAYLTGAYRKKLEERKQLEEELKKEEEVEKTNDVTKQKDLTRFHKHLFDRIASGPAGNDKLKTDKQKSDSQKSPVKDRQRTHSRDEDPQERREHRDTHSRDSERGRDRRPSSSSSLPQTESTNEGENPSLPGNEGENPSLRDRTESTSSAGTPAELAARKEIEKEERRKVASAKRTDEQAQLSARERYLARKKAKLTKTAPATSP